MLVSFDQEQQILAIERWHDWQKAYCLMNFSNEQQLVTLPLNEGLKILFNSAAAEWNGPGVSDQIQPHSIIIYTN
jgi:hypothetical protein